MSKETMKISNEIASNVWVLRFTNPLKNMDDRQIESLPEQTKDAILHNWERLVWNKNTQATKEQKLKNIRDLNLYAEVKFPEWVMDRLKEAVREYVEGQWFSSIVLCGAIVEFIAVHVAQLSLKKRIKTKDVGLGSLLHELKELGEISKNEYKMLHSVKELRNKHVHLLALDDDAKLKKDSLEAITTLLEYLHGDPYWHRKIPHFANIDSI